MSVQQGNWQCLQSPQWCSREAPNSARVAQPDVFMFGFSSSLRRLHTGNLVSPSNCTIKCAGQVRMFASWSQEQMVQVQTCAGGTVDRQGAHARAPVECGAAMRRICDCRLAGSQVIPL